MHSWTGPRAPTDRPVGFRRPHTTDERAGDGSWVWLERDCDRAEQTWRLIPTEDSLASIIEAVRSEHSLYATTNPKVPAAEEGGSVTDPTPVFLRSTHRASWQQWMIARDEKASQTAFLLVRARNTKSARERS